MESGTVKYKTKIGEELIMSYILQETQKRDLKHLNLPRVIKMEKRTQTI